MTARPSSSSSVLPLEDDSGTPTPKKNPSMMLQEEEEEEASRGEEDKRTTAMASPTRLVSDDEKCEKVEEEKKEASSLLVNNNDHPEERSDGVEPCTNTNNDSADASAAETPPSNNSTIMALNEAFTSLESMRIANLELELNRSVDPRHCVTCLRREVERQRAGQRGTTWGFHKRRAVPCLVCAAPTCLKHASTVHRDFQKQLTVCCQCAPLFGLDFIVDLIHNGDDDPAYRRAAVEKVVDSYDRALIALKFARQYIDRTCEALEKSAARDNRIGLGSSSVGLVSGVTGVAAAAIHLAAFSTVAAAAVLTPVGPPLLIASIVFGGTAAAASSGSEAVSYYSEPNQCASCDVVL